MTEATAPQTPTVQIVGDSGSAERILNTIKMVGAVVLLLLFGCLGCYWWGRIDGVKSQTKKLENLQSIVVEKQVPVIQKVYEDRIIYKDRVETIEVPKIIEKKVYQNICLDDEGVNAFNQFTKP